MEKIAAKILECKLINHGLSYAIRLFVDFGCQTNITLFNILDTMNFFKVESFDQIEGKYCYVILNNDQWPFSEFEQFPCHGTLSIKFSNGTEYLIDRNAHNLEPIQKLKVPTKVIETEVNGNTSVQNTLRENILKLLSENKLGINKQGTPASEIYSYLSPNYDLDSKISKEICKLMNEEKIYGYGNNRGRKYVLWNLRNKITKSNLSTNPFEI